jgi:hypothetical protein
MPELGLATTQRLGEVEAKLHGVSSCGAPIAFAQANWE